MSKQSSQKSPTEPQASLGSINWRDFDPSWLPDGEKSTFVEEFITYRDHLDDLLEYEGQYVVIKGKTILGHYRDRRAALAAAHKEFGAVPVLAKKIVEMEPVRRLVNVVF